MCLTLNDLWKPDHPVPKIVHFFCRHFVSPCYVLCIFHPNSPHLGVFRYHVCLRGTCYIACVSALGYPHTRCTLSSSQEHVVKMVIVCVPSSGELCEGSPPVHCHWPLTLNSDPRVNWVFLYTPAGSGRVGTPSPHPPPPPHPTPHTHVQGSSCPRQVYHCLGMSWFVWLVNTLQNEHLARSPKSSSLQSFSYHTLPANILGTSVQVPLSFLPIESLNLKGS